MSTIIEIGDDSTSVIFQAAAHNFIRSFSVVFGRKRLDRAITSHVREKHNLLIGDRTAEVIKQEIGSAIPPGKSPTMLIRARHAAEGVPKDLILTDEEIHVALSDNVSDFVRSVCAAFEQVPEEFLTEATENGILLKGHDALKNLDRRLSIGTNLPVAVVE